MSKVKSWEDAGEPVDIIILDVSEKTNRVVGASKKSVDSDICIELDKNDPVVKAWNNNKYGCYPGQKQNKLPKEEIMAERAVRAVEDQGDGFYYDPSVEVAITEYEDAYEKYKNVRNEKWRRLWDEFSMAWKNVISQCEIDHEMVDILFEKRRVESWIQADWDQIWNWEFGRPGRIDNAEIASASWERWERDFEKRYGNWEKYIILNLISSHEWIEFNDSSPSPAQRV